jgi:oligopeptide transport system ATP-binding protein
VTAPLLDIRNVSKRYLLHGRLPFSRRVPLQAVSNVNLSIARGEALGLVGESGSGKSTLAHVVLNLTPPTSGEVWFDGRRISGLQPAELRPYRQRIQLIFQDPFSSLDPTQSVGSMLDEILSVHRLFPDRRQRRDRVVELLAQVGLPPSAARRYPHEFSGGQRQRVVIARALATSPDVIVADEPVSALDVSIQAQIVQLIERLRRDLGLTLLLIAHDLGLVQHMSDRVGVLYLGRLVELAPTRRLFARPRHPYTEMLLSAVPTLEAGRRRDRIRPVGEIPSPLSPPSGCVFRTRCRYALPACATSVPELRRVGEGHFKACIRDDILAGGPNA